MIERVTKMKFENIFAFAMVVVLAIALLMFRNDSEMANLIVGAFIAAFSAITAFFFTKHNPNK